MISSRCLQSLKGSKNNGIGYGSKRTVNGPTRIDRQTRTYATDGVDISAIYVDKPKFGRQELARMLNRTNDLGINVIAARVGRPLQVSELQSALTSLQMRHIKLQHTPEIVLRKFGLFARTDQSIPVVIENRVDQQQSEWQLDRTVENMLNTPMNRMMKVQVISGKDSSDIIIGVNNLASDLASSGMLMRELLEGYALRLDYAENVVDTNEAAPTLGDISKIFPQSHQPGRWGFREMYRSMQEIGRLLKATATQSTFRFPQTPLNGATSHVSVIAPDNLSEAINKTCERSHISVMEAVAGATLLGSKDIRTFAGTEPGCLDFEIEHDLRQSFEPPIPLNSIGCANVTTYHQILPQFNDTAYNMGRLVNCRVQEVRGLDTLLDAYYAMLTRARLLKRGKTPIPEPPFHFVDLSDLGIKKEVADLLNLGHVSAATTALPRVCQVIVTNVNRKVSASFNFPKGILSDGEVQRFGEETLQRLKVTKQPKSGEKPVEETISL